MSNYTVNMPKQAGWLVYINGLEVPVMSVNTTFGVWKVPTATINMVPHPILNRIGAEDRLQVVIFYLDHHWASSGPTFRLLGEFEVVGWSYQNSPRQRSITLACVSQLQIFEQLRFYFISSVNDAIAGMGPTERTSGNTATAVKVLYPASLFRDGLTSPIVTREDWETEDTIDTSAFIKRPIDFVTNIFRALLWKASGDKADENYVEVGTRHVPRSSISAPGKNFFARWLEMTKFHTRWAALPVMEDGSGTEGCFPIIKATQDTAALPALQQQIGESVGESGTAWELLKKVFSYMYMEVCVIPAPAAAVLEAGTNKVLPPWSDLKKFLKTDVADVVLDEETKEALTQSKEDFRLTSGSGIRGIPTFFVKPMCTFALPPACNVIFPPMINQYTAQETYMTQPTRVYLGEQFISSRISGPNTGMLGMVQALMVTGYPASVRQRMQTLLSAEPESSNTNFLLFPEEFFKGPNSLNLNAPPWMFLLQQRMKAENPTGAQTSEDLELQRLIDATTLPAIEDEITSGLGGLFDAYAKYEFYRARYAERIGAVSLLWNPYIVPGFPVAVFDQEGSGFDTMGYANTVNHSMSATGSMTTSVNLSFVRSMPEFVGATYEGKPASKKKKTPETGLDIEPAEVVPEIRDNFQKVKAAHNIYSRLFYQDQLLGTTAVFNWKDILNLVDLDGNKLDLEKDAESIDEAVQLEPKARYRGLFTEYDTAMRYASRPACSLREYVESYHAEKLSTLLAKGTVKGVNTSFYSPTNDKDGRRGAVFWSRIYKLKQGPGDVPDVKISNMGGPPKVDKNGNVIEEGYQSAGPNGWTTIHTHEMAQTRQNWDKKLEKYRKIVRSNSKRFSPQV